MALVVPELGGSTDPFAHERKVASAVLTRWERVVEAELQRSFERQKKVTLAKLNSRKSFSLARKGKITADAIFDNEKWRAQMYDDAAAWTTSIIEEIGPATFDSIMQHGSTTKREPVGVSFDLTDPKVTDLITTRANYVAGASDTTYQAITDELSVGQEAGEGIDKLAFRVESVFDDASEWRSRTIARTEVVSATNGASFLGAGQTGIVSGKSWLATADDRTRISHILIDGETVGLDEEFSNGLKFPGDPDGEPEEIINCRCTVLFDAEATADHPQHAPEDTPAPPERAPRGPTRTPTAPEATPAPVPPEPPVRGTSGVLGEQQPGVPSVADIEGVIHEKGAAGAYTQLDGPAIEDVLVRIEPVEAPLSYAGPNEAAVELRFKITSQGKALLETQAEGAAPYEANPVGWQTRSDVVVPKKFGREVALTDHAWSGYGQTFVNEQEWGMIRVLDVDVNNGGFAFDGTTQVFIKAEQFSEETVAEAMRLMGMTDAYPTAEEMAQLAENRVATIFADGGSYASPEARAAALQRAEDFGATPESLIRTVDKASGRVEYRFPEDVAQKIVEDTKAQVFNHQWGGTQQELIELLADDRQALLSTTERWSEGIGKTGMSSSSDVRTGGASYVFTRQTAAIDNLERYGVQLVFDGEKVLTRTDFFAYAQDSFGVTNPAESRTLVETNNTITSLRQGVINKSGQETMFKDRISFDDLKWIQVDSTEAKEAIIAGLDEAGVTEIGGRPLDEMILTRYETRESVQAARAAQEPVVVQPPPPSPRTLPPDFVLDPFTPTVPPNPEFPNGVFTGGNPGDAVSDFSGASGVGEVSIKPDPTQVLVDVEVGDTTVGSGHYTAYTFDDGSFVNVTDKQVFVKLPHSSSTFVEFEMPAKNVWVDLTKNTVKIEHAGGYESEFHLVSKEFTKYQSAV